MREALLRVLGLVILLIGGLTLLALILAQSFDTEGPGLGDWAQSADIRRALWIAAGGVYMGAGIMLALLRRWAAVLLIVGAVLAAVSMAYDMAAFAQAGMDSLGVARIRSDIVSLICALALTALTVPLARRQILR